MYQFTYHRPTGLRQAGNMLTKLEDPKLLAGGMTLPPTMKQRLASPANLVDIGKLDGLAGIELKGRSLVIGATTRHVDVANSSIVQENLPALADLAGHIGDPHVRHMGTIGGSVANNDPNEIITKVMFPLAKKAAYMKFPNPASRYALVGVFVSKRGSEIRVAVTGAGASGVFRVTAFEEALKKRFAPKSLDGLTVPATGLASDIHGSAEYRAHLIGVLAKRAVAKATA